MSRSIVVVDPLFPRRLRELREAAGLSLRDLAKVCLSSKSHLHDFESGRKTPRLDTLERIDQALGADGELRRMVVPVQAGDPFGMDRRSFVGLAAGLAVAAPGAGYLGSGSFGDPAVTSAHLRTARLRRLDDYLGGADTYPIYLAEMDSTAAVLRDRRVPSTVERGLLSVLAEQAQMAGFSAFDADWHNEAERLFRLSLAMAQDAGDPALMANALTFLGYQRLAIDGRGGVGFSVASCDLTLSATPRVRALQLERRAWAHAVEGQLDAAASVLAEATTAVHDSDDRPEPDWAMWVDSTEIQIMAGRCWTILRRPMRAIPVLDDVLSRYADTHGRDKALYSMFLARAYLQANEVEKSCEVARRAMDLASGVSSVRPRRQVEEFVRKLAPYEAVRAATELKAYASEWISRMSPLAPRQDNPPAPQQQVLQ
jgi:transcriptional regulator with XRE-family HTH domain